MKRDRKKQDDRLLKQLPHLERRQQEQLRKSIMNDPALKMV